MSGNNTIKQFYTALKKKDEEAIPIEGESTLVYLKKHAGKYKPNGMLKRVLMIEWRENEQLERDKAIIQAAVEYISHFLSLIARNDEHKPAYIANLRTGIADLKPSLCRLDKDLNFMFLLGNTNTQMTPFQHKIAESLFYTNALPKNTSKYDLDHLNIPFLRTILESKIKSILGVDILRDSRNNAIDLSDLLNILPDLRSVSLHKAYNPFVLGMIMKWLNHHMHRNLRPEAYIIHQVLQYILPIFKPGKIEHEGGVLFSVNSSAFTNNMEDYHTEVELILKSKYPNCYIEWKSKEVSTMFKKTV